MKEFQSRVVATWVVALPIAFALFQTSRHEVVRLTTDAQTEIAQQLRLAQHASFVGDFILTFASLVVIIVVIDALAKLIRQVIPDPAVPREPRGKLFP